MNGIALAAALPKRNAMKIAIVVTGTDRFGSSRLKTGLWLSECTHIYHSAAERGYEVVFASPRGGDTPVDPISLRPLLLDGLSGRYWKEPAFRLLLRCTRSLEEIASDRFDCVYLAGGHGAMYDFPSDAHLQSLLRRQFESGRLVAAICHGVCGLLEVRLSDGKYLIEGRKLTGFSWFEERLSARRKVVPFDLEAALKRHGARYRKAVLPLTGKVVEAGNLLTGQNPFSSRRLAAAVVDRLENNVKNKKHESR